MTDQPDNERQFKELLPRIRVIVGRRRPSWTLSTLPWEDVESILITRIYQKLHLYDPARPFDNWANRLISRALSSLLRDMLYKHEKPCVTASAYGGDCIYNLGGDRCGFTASGIQCSQCPLYAKWAAKKEMARNLNASLSLESHAQEVQNMQEDFIDIAAAKVVIDAAIIAQLNPHEAKVYRLLFIEHKTPEEVSKRLRYKTKNNAKVSQVLRKMVARFKRMARDVIDTQDLA